MAVRKNLGWIAANEHKDFVRGAADSTAALQDIIDRANPLGMPVYIEPGEYTCNGTILIRDNTKLIGAGAKRTTIRHNSGSDLISNGSQSASRRLLNANEVSGLHLIGSNRQGKGLSIDSWARGKTEDMWIENFDTGVDLNPDTKDNDAGTNWNYLFNTRIENCRLGATTRLFSNSNDFYGLYVSGCDIGYQDDRGNNNGIHGGQFTDNNVGIDLNGSYSNSFFGIQFSNHAVNAYEIDAAARSNMFFGCSYDAWAFNDQSGSTHEISANGIRFWGETPGVSAQPASPGASAAAIIAVLQQYGLVQ